MWNVLTSMVGWLNPLRSPHRSTEEGITPTLQMSPLPPDLPIDPNQKKKLAQLEESLLMADWEYLLSTTEQIYRLQSEKHNQEVQRELEKITRVSNTVKYRSRIGTLLKEKYATLPATTLKVLLESRLDASKRDKILRDLFKGVSTSWLISMKKFFSSTQMESLTSRWQEVPYKKGVISSLIAMAFHASHPASEKGLTIIIASDILWSIHLSLSREITTELERPLTTEENEWILDKVLSLLSDLIILWVKTATSMGTISTREGKLPQRWEIDREAERSRHAKRKEEEIASGSFARYNDGPNDILWKSIRLDKHARSKKPLQKPLEKKVIVEGPTFAERRQLLASSLIFTAPKVNLQTSVLDRKSK